MFSPPSAEIATLSLRLLRALVKFHASDVSTPNAASSLIQSHRRSTPTRSQFHLQNHRMKVTAELNIARDSLAGSRSDLAVSIQGSDVDELLEYHRS